MPEWIAKVRVMEAREVIVEGDSREEAKAAAERGEWKYDDGVALDLIDWEVRDVRPNE